MCGRHHSGLRTLCTDARDIPALNVTEEMHNHGAVTLLLRPPSHVHNEYEAHHLIIIDITITIMIVIVDLFPVVLWWRSIVELQAGLNQPGNSSSLASLPFTCSQLLPITTAAPSKAPPQVTRAFFNLFLALYSLHGSTIYSPHGFFFSLFLPSHQWTPEQRMCFIN